MNCNRALGKACWEQQREIRYYFWSETLGNGSWRCISSGLGKETFCEWESWQERTVYLVNGSWGWITGSRWGECGSRERWDWASAWLCKMNCAYYSLSFSTGDCVSGAPLWSLQALTLPYSSPPPSFLPKSDTWTVNSLLHKLSLLKINVTDGWSGEEHSFCNLQHEAEWGASRSRFLLLFLLRLWGSHGFSSYFHCGEFSNLENQAPRMHFLSKPFFMETAPPRCLGIFAAVCQAEVFCSEQACWLYRALVGSQHLLA